MGPCLRYTPSIRRRRLNCWQALEFLDGRRDRWGKRSTRSSARVAEQNAVRAGGSGQVLVGSWKIPVLDGGCVTRQNLGWARGQGRRPVSAVIASEAQLPWKHFDLVYQRQHHIHLFDASLKQQHRRKRRARTYYTYRTARRQ